MERKELPYETSEKPWNTAKDSTISEIGMEKVDALKTSVLEIEELIEEREVLSKKIFDESEKEKISINNFLNANQAIDSDDVRERIGLRQKIVELSELQLNEKITSWKDIALLKQELREIQRELTEKEERRNMIERILED